MWRSNYITSTPIETKMHSSSFLFIFNMMFFFILHWNISIFDVSMSDVCLRDKIRLKKVQFEINTCNDFDKFVICHRDPTRIRDWSPETRSRPERISESPKRSALPQTGAEFRERSTHLLRAQSCCRWKVLRTLHHQHGEGL